MTAFASRTPFASRPVPAQPFHVPMPGLCKHCKGADNGHPFAVCNSCRRCFHARCAALQTNERIEEFVCMDCLAPPPLASAALVTHNSTDAFHTSASAPGCHPEYERASPDVQQRGRPRVNHPEYEMASPDVQQRGRPRVNSVGDSDTFGLKRKEFRTSDIDAPSLPDGSSTPPTPRRSNSLPILPGLSKNVPETHLFGGLSPSWGMGDGSSPSTSEGGLSTSPPPLPGMATSSSPPPLPGMESPTIRPYPDPVRNEVETRPPFLPTTPPRKNSFFVQARYPAALAVAPTPLRMSPMLSRNRSPMLSHNRPTIGMGLSTPATAKPLPGLSPTFTAWKPTVKTELTNLLEMPRLENRTPLPVRQSIFTPQTVAPSRSWPIKTEGRGLKRHRDGDIMIKRETKAIDKESACPEEAKDTPQKKRTGKAKCKKALGPPRSKRTKRTTAKSKRKKKQPPKAVAKKRGKPKSNNKSNPDPAHKAAILKKIRRLLEKAPPMALEKHLLDIPSHFGAENVDLLKSIGWADDVICIDDTVHLPVKRRKRYVKGLCPELKKQRRKEQNRIAAKRSRLRKKLRTLQQNGADSTTIRDALNAVATTTPKLEEEEERQGPLPGSHLDRRLFKQNIRVKTQTGQAVPLQLGAQWAARAAHIALHGHPSATPQFYNNYQLQNQFYSSMAKYGMQFQGVNNNNNQTTHPLALQTDSASMAMMSGGGSLPAIRRPQVKKEHALYDPTQVALPEFTGDENILGSLLPPEQSVPSVKTEQIDVGQLPPAQPMQGLFGSAARPFTL